MNTVSDPGLRLPGTFHLPRGTEPLNQRIASEIEQTLMGQFGGEEVMSRMFTSGHETRRVVISRFLDLILYAFRTEQLKSQPSFKGLKSGQLAALDESVVDTVNKKLSTPGFATPYNAEILVINIIQAYADHGYIIYES